MHDCQTPTKNNNSRALPRSVHGAFDRQLERRATSIEPYGALSTLHEDQPRTKNNSRCRCMNDSSFWRATAQPPSKNSALSTVHNRKGEIQIYYAAIDESNRVKKTAIRLLAKRYFDVIERIIAVQARSIEGADGRKGGHRIERTRDLNLNHFIINNHTAI